MEANMKLSDVLLAFAARDPRCPSETDVLGYSENTLSSLRRIWVEKHFAECDDCRQLLTFLGEESVEEAAPLSQAEVSEQANRVLGYIRNDEHNQSRSEQKAR